MFKMWFLYILLINDLIVCVCVCVCVHAYMVLVYVQCGLSAYIRSSSLSVINY